MGTSCLGALVSMGSCAFVLLLVNDAITLLLIGRKRSCASEQSPLNYTVVIPVLNDNEHLEPA